MIVPPTITDDQGYWLPTFKANYDAAAIRAPLVQAAAALLRVHDDELVNVLVGCGLWSLVEAMTQGAYMIESLRRLDQPMPDGPHAWRIYASKLRRDGMVNKPKVHWRHGE